MQWGHAVATHHTPPLGAALRPASLRYITHQQHPRDVADDVTDSGRAQGALDHASRDPVPLLPQWHPTRGRQQRRAVVWVERVRRSVSRAWARTGGGARVALLLAMLLFAGVCGFAAALASGSGTPPAPLRAHDPPQAPLPPPPTAGPGAPPYDSWLQYAAEPGPPDADGWRAWVHPSRPYRIPGLDAASLTRLHMCCRAQDAASVDNDTVCCAPGGGQDAGGALVCIVRHGQLHVFAPPDTPLPPDATEVACTLRWA